MESFVIGVNHRTASLELRGCVAFAPGQARDALVRLHEAHPEQGFVLLSTCNRTELYGTLSSNGASPQECLAGLLLGRTVSSPDLASSLYEMTGKQAILHLFRVAGALDSMLVGEDQILGQVRVAHDEAKACKTTNMFLDVLFRHAVTAGKRVKTETSMSRNSLSLGTLAVKAAQQKLGDLTGKSALVVGSGKMGELALRNLLQAGVSNLYVTVRTKHGKGGGLAEAYPSVSTIDYDRRHELIDHCDIVVSATQCPYFTLKRDLVEESLITNRSHVFLDLAVPRDIDPTVGELPGCSYFDLDQLQMIAAGNHDLRKGEVSRAEMIIGEELADLERWWTHRKAMPTLRRLRVNLRRKWKTAEALMVKRLAAEGAVEDFGPQQWGESYSQLSSDTLDTVFYRLREHCTPEELEVLYRCLDRAFRKW
jgi:glutamyl-tRNA reductase